MIASRRARSTVVAVLLVLHGLGDAAEEGRRNQAALAKSLRDLWPALRDATPATGAQGRLARVWIAMAMHELGEPGSRDRFRELLNDKDAAVRREAAAALGKLRNLDVTDLCIHALEGNDGPATCAELAARLAEMGELRAVPALVQAARLDDARLHSTIDKALRRLGNPEIYIVGADGSDPINLTDHPASDSCPAWSSDGGKIVFASEREEGWEIYVMNADGSELRRLTDSNGTNAEPAWSPDGKSIAFRSSRDGNSEIYVMGADGGDPHNLTRHPSTDSHPTWSPDGTQIAFSSKRDRECDVYVMNADGTSLANVTKRAGCDHQPSWSPDGLQLAFSSWRHGGWAAYVMSPDGSDQTRLAWIPQDSRPTWSPDSASVAFASIGEPCRPTRSIAVGFGSKREGEPWPRVHVIGTDRSGTRKLALPNAMCMDVAWAPNGKRLAASIHKYVDPSSVADVAKAAASDNPHVRHYAVITLARSMDPSVSALLHSALGDGHPSVRLEAARGLAWLGDASAMSALRRVVLGSETDRRVRTFAWQALRPLTIDLGPLVALETMQATNLSRALMEFREPRGAYFSLFDLYAGLLATERTGIPRLSRCATSENGLTRFIALRVLGDIGDESAQPVFERALKDANAAVAAEAKRALGKLQPRREPESQDVLLFTDFSSPDLGEWEIRDTWQFPTKGGTASPPFMQPSNWHVCPVSKCLAQDSNILGEGGGTHIVTGSPDWTDYEITCRAVSYDNDSFGILFRYADEKNNLRLVTSSQGKRILLVQWVRGEERILTRVDRGYKPWIEYDLKVVAKGAHIEGWLGDLRLSAECTEPPCGRIGFMTSANALTHFDGLVVRDLRSKGKASRPSGLPAILLMVTDSEDPVPVGNTTTYLISAKNVGSAACTALKIAVELEPKAQYVSSKGVTTGALRKVKGLDAVDFSPLPRLEPKTEATWRVVVKALKPGRVRFAVTMVSDQLARPVRDTETTNIYRRPVK